MNANSLAADWPSLVGALGNHLWQSTVFAGAVFLVTLLLRERQARIRHWLWLAASAKFLLPFSLLIGLGARVQWTHHVQTTQVGAYAAVRQISQPFTAAVTLNAPFAPLDAASTAAAHMASPMQAALTGIWLLGFSTVFAFWYFQWRRIAKLARMAQPLQHGREFEILRKMKLASGLRRPVEILSSSHAMEPGIFGIIRPVLLWPQSISSHLDDAHLETILVHELCHVRRNDNLISLLHILVEALFWFHPLAWWIEAQLVKERERACDEAVVLLCRRPQVYAESILKVCELCVEPVLPCVSGITGADLKKRIGLIMTGAVLPRFDLRERLMLAAFALAAVAVPLACGLYAQAIAVPEWQTAAGGKLSFDIISVHENKDHSGEPYTPPITNFPLGSTSKYNPTGGHFSAKNVKVLDIIDFAYKLTGIEGGNTLYPQLPDWAKSKTFDIEARASEGQEPTKDQMRLMMQSLLADRFKLVMHAETRATSVYALHLIEPGKLGPQLKPHPASFSCAAAASTTPPGAGKLPLAADGLTQDCGYIRGDQDKPGHMHFVSRGAPIFEIAKDMTVWKDDGLATLDQTGLEGLYDFTIDVALDDVTQANSQDAQWEIYDHSDLPQALRKQLGIRVDKTKAPVSAFVLDHLELPSTN